MFRAAVSRILVSVVAAGAALSVVPASAQITPAERVLMEQRAGVRFTQEPAVPHAGDFAMGPAKFRLSLAPGEEQTVEVQVTSRTDGEHLYSFETEDFAAAIEENESTRLFGAVAGPFSARGWVRAAVPSLELTHGERAYVPVTIRIPEDAEPGDHYAALLLKRALEPHETTDKGFNVISRVGILFLITVEGPAIQDTELLSLSSRKKLYWFYPAMLDLRARNKGTVYAAPFGTIKIRNILGFQVDEIPVTDWTVLRDSTRSIAFEWRPRFALGRYKAETDLEIFGKKPVPMTATFWMIPVLPVLIALFVIFLVSFIVQYFFSRFEIRKKS